MIIICSTNSELLLGVPKLLCSRVTLMVIHVNKICHTINETHGPKSVSVWILLLFLCSLLESEKVNPCQPKLCQRLHWYVKRTNPKIYIFWGVFVSHSRLPSEFCGIVRFIFLCLMILILLKVVTSAIILGFIFDKFTQFSAL